MAFSSPAPAACLQAAFQALSGGAACGAGAVFFDELAALSGQVPGDGAIVRGQPLLRQDRGRPVLGPAGRRSGQAPVGRAAHRQGGSPPGTFSLAWTCPVPWRPRISPPSTEGKAPRLDAVKWVLDDFLKRRKGDRVGLILFGTAPFIQAPFTEDLETCRELLRQAQVGMAGPKTAIGDAIGLAINMFKDSSVKDKLLILLTDGNDSSSKLEPEKAAAIAKDGNIVIDTRSGGRPDGRWGTKTGRQNPQERGRDDGRRLLLGRRRPRP